MKTRALAALCVIGLGGAPPASAWNQQGTPTFETPDIVINGSTCPEGQAYIEAEKRCGSYVEVAKICGYFAQNCDINWQELESLLGPPPPADGRPGGDYFRPKTWEEIDTKAACKLFGGTWKLPSKWGRLTCGAGLLVTYGGAYSCGQTLGFGCALATVGGGFITFTRCVGQCIGPGGGPVP